MNILIGVGGSGQNVVDHYLRLFELTKMGASHLPDIYIVDADVTTSTSSGEPTLFGDIRYRFEKIKDNRPSDNVNKQINVISPYYIEASTGSNTLGRSLKNNDPDIVGLDDIADAFCTEKEMNILTSDGMDSNPRAGAISFTKAIYDNNILNDLIDSINLNNDINNIIMVGSCFGGTGAGCLLPLYNKLHERVVQKGLNNTNFYPYISLPWFDVENATNINNRMRLNAVSSIYHWLTNIDLSNNKVSINLSSFPYSSIRANYNTKAHLDYPHIYYALVACSIQSKFIPIKSFEKYDISTFSISEDNNSNDKINTENGLLYFNYTEYDSENNVNNNKSMSLYELINTMILNVNITDKIIDIFKNDLNGIELSGELLNLCRFIAKKDDIKIKTSKLDFHLGILPYSSKIPANIAYKETYKSITKILKNSKGYYSEDYQWIKSLIQNTGLHIKHNKVEKEYSDDDLIAKITEVILEEYQNKISVPEIFNNENLDYKKSLVDNNYNSILEPTKMAKIVFGYAMKLIMAKATNGL
jgi:hypothetical protein